MVPETFPHDPLDPVSPDRALVDLPRDRQPQSGIFTPVIPGQDFETGIRRNEWVFKNPLEISGFCEFLFAGKGRLAGRFPFAFAVHRTGHPLMRFCSIRFQADSRFLPLARRALMIACPARVDIRARKP